MTDSQKLDAIMEELSEIRAVLGMASVAVQEPKAPKLHGRENATRAQVIGRRPG